MCLKNDEKCDLCIRKNEPATTAAKLHLHFLLDMLALVTLGLRSLLRFNHFFLRNKHPHNRCTRHQPMTTPNASHLQIEKTHSENWQLWNCRPVPLSSVFKQSWAWCNCCLYSDNCCSMLCFSLLNLKCWLLPVCQHCLWASDAGGLKDSFT